jgi:hypothetical protein
MMAFGFLASLAAAGSAPLPIRLPIFLVAISLSSLGIVANVAATDSIRERHEQLHTRWAGQVEQLAAKCEAQGQNEAAETIRQLLRTSYSGVISIPVISTNGQTATALTTGTPKPEWQLALTRLRKQCAKELFDLATNAFRAGDISFCYDLVRETIEHDSDHGPARALMGYTKYRRHSPPEN